MFCPERNLIALHQLAATPCFDLTIDPDLAILNELFGRAAGIHQILPLQE